MISNYMLYLRYYNDATRDVAIMMTVLHVYDVEFRCSCEFPLRGWCGDASSGVVLAKLAFGSWRLRERLDI